MPTADAANTTNYIQLDMSVISKNARPCPIPLLIKDYDIIEEWVRPQPRHACPVNYNVSRCLCLVCCRNMLTLASSPVDRPPRHVSYCVNIFSALLAHKRDYHISVQFAGATVRSTRRPLTYDRRPTKCRIYGSLSNCTQHRTRSAPKSQFPEWNEQLAFGGSFPSLCQSFRVQVRDGGCAGGPGAAVADVRFDEMLPATREPDRVPSFGPAYVQLVAADERTHVGRLLMSIRTEEEAGGERAPGAGQVAAAAVSMDVPQFVEVRFWGGMIRVKNLCDSR